MTQADCLKALGCPQSSMSDVETGSRRIDIVQLRDLCQILGVDLTDLIKEFERLLGKGLRQFFAETEH